MVGGLFIGVWVARYLGPQQFGTLNYAMALAGLFTAFATLGLDGLIVRNVVQDPSSRDTVLGTALTLRLAAGLVTITLIQGVAWLVRPDEATTRLVVALVSVGIVARAIDVLKPWFESQVRSKYTVIAQNTAFVVVAVVRLILILTEAPLAAFALAMTVDVLLAKLLMWLFYVQTGGTPCKLHFEFHKAKKLLNEGWPLILSGLAVTIYMRIDQIMLGSMLSDEAVGIYAAALRVSEIWYFVPMTIVASVMPNITAMQYSSPERYRYRFQQLFALLSASSYAVVIIVILTAGTVMSVLYGDSYAGAENVLVLHIFASIFVALGLVSGRWLLNQGLTKISLLRTTVGAVVNVGLNLVLIPRNGVIGAAMATVISQAVSAFFVHMFLSRTRSMFIMQCKGLALQGLWGSLK